jgi:RNA polymerase sigma-70 factor (ECF subfamily)
VTSSDRDITIEVVQGDADAFGLLVRKYEARLFGFIYAIVRDAAGAEDIAQNAFLRAYNNLERFDSYRPFYPWLASIAFRLAQNWLRTKQSLTHREGTAIDCSTEPHVEPTGETALITNERSRILWETVMTLPCSERTAVVLYYRTGLSVNDVARVVGVTEGTVKQLLFRARRHLREKLGSTLLLEKD